jgi:predicted DNA-binding antitoxin AbrB/MazE fold protein
MTTRCTAIYENGLLRPLTPPNLAEGQEVELFIVAERSEAARSGRRRAPAEILAEIAALPQSDDRGFSGSDHDQVLYSRPA